jgi:hypothetical protein
LLKKKIKKRKKEKIVNKKSYLVTSVTTVTIATTVTTVTTVTSVTTVTTVTYVTYVGRKVGFNYLLILLRSLFHKHQGRTVGPTDRRMDRQLDF